MKVLLVQPPVEDYYDTSIRTYPLALAYIAAALQDICAVSILDCRTGHKRHASQNDFPELRDFYREGLRTPFALFTRYSRYGMDKTEIRKAIEDANPDIIGISSSFAAYSGEAAEVAAIAKKIDPRIVTVMGGTHPTLFPEHVLEDENVDYVIRGEGETPFYELIRSLGPAAAAGLKAISGLCFRLKGESHIGAIHVEDNIDVIPARHLLPADKYRIGKKPYTFFLTSRGCPFKCSFCGKPPVPYRRRTLQGIEREVDEIEHIGIKAVDFEDDMLNLDIPFFHSVLDLVKGRGITLSAMNGIYSQTLDIETLTRMHEAGFSRLNFSLVDTSRAVHATQRRRYPANLLKILDWLEASPFMIEAHFIIGLPGQTAAEIMDTLVFLMGKRVLPGPSMYYPAPGSLLFGDLAGSDSSALFRYCRSSVMFEGNRAFSRRTTFTFMKLVRFINMVKSLIDDTPGASELKDLADSPRMKRNERDRHIFQTLLDRRRFVAFNTRTNEYAEEAQDEGLVDTFFENIKGVAIKGFRTHNRVFVS